MSAKRVVVIGGGTGTFTVLQGLRTYDHDITAIISMADDGGSTGVLRDELGVLPPGDLRQALVALSEDSPVLRNLFNYRFEEGSLKGHNFGNLMLSALEKVTGSADQAILEAGKLLAIQGTVIPVTKDQMRLEAESKTGARISGEHAIEEYIWSGQGKVEKLWVEPNCSIHPLARQAMLQADLIVIAPGSLFTSLIPNFLVQGVVEALEQSKAKIAYIVNLMTERGQTQAFYVQDFAQSIQDYLGERTLDYVLYNTSTPTNEQLDLYKKEMERIPVHLDEGRCENLEYTLLGRALISTQKPQVASHGDALARSRTLIRHDSKKVAEVLNELLGIE